MSREGSKGDSRPPKLHDTDDTDRGTIDTASEATTATGNLNDALAAEKKGMEVLSDRQSTEVTETADMDTAPLRRASTPKRREPASRKPSAWDAAKERTGQRTPPRGRVRTPKDPFGDAVSGMAELPVRGEKTVLAGKVVVEGASGAHESEVERNRRKSLEKMQEQHTALLGQREKARQEREKGELFVQWFKIQLIETSPRAKAKNIAAEYKAWVTGSAERILEKNKKSILAVPDFNELRVEAPGLLGEDTTEVGKALPLEWEHQESVRIFHKDKLIAALTNSELYSLRLGVGSSPEKAVVPSVEAQRDTAVVSRRSVERTQVVEPPQKPTEKPTLTDRAKRLWQWLRHGKNY